MAASQHWITGIHAVQALLETQPERIIELWLSNEKAPNVRQQIVLDKAFASGISVQSISKQQLQKKTNSKHTQGIAAQVRAKKESNENDLKELLADSKNKELLFLVLDCVQDPHNLGACLRTADAAGVDAVILPKDKSCPITHVVSKVASGAVETVTIFRVSNLSRTLDYLKEQGIWLIGTSDKAEKTLYQTSLTGSVAVIMGAEAEGMRQLTQKKCDLLVKLPMAGSIVSSLNVSVATGVCLYEVLRQRQDGR